MRRRSLEPHDPQREPVGDGASFKLGVLEHIIVFRLRRIRNHLSESFRAGTWRDGIKPGGFVSLAVIEANPGISQTDLARETGFDQASLVSIIDDLERRRWATRRRHAEDRRRHSIEATPKGQDALKTLFSHALDNERQARAALTPDELAAFMTALDKMYRGLI